MATTHSYKSEAEGYWKLLKNTSNEVKLRLITLLSQSMTENSDRTNAATDNSAQKRTERFIARFAGAWHGDESAEDIVGIINEGRTCRKPVSFD